MCIVLHLLIRCCWIIATAGAFRISRSLNTVGFFHDGRILRISPQIGYNFTHKELYVKADADWQYWPEKQASFEVSVGNGNRIYSSVVLDQLKQLPDSTFNFDQLELDYFKDVYLNLFHNIEIVNGLFIKAGVSVHWRYLINNSKVILEKPLPDKDWAALRGIRSEYNSFAPRIRIEWTPGMYYYMNGRRKMNVGSSMPTFMLDYERALKVYSRVRVLMNVGSLIYSKT